MSRLAGKVAIVTGASRGIGKGIALGLGEAGATVYVTGRSTREHPGHLPGTVEDTADQVSERGGRGVAVACDHRNDAEVEAIYRRIHAEQGRLDLLVNNALASPDQRVLWSGKRFWELPIELWDDLMDVGLRSHFVASKFAVPLMLTCNGACLINVASHGAGSAKADDSDTIIPYSVGKAGLHRMTADMATELKPEGIAVIEIWPPGTRTEGVLAQPQLFPNLSAWAEPIFTGRVVAALLAGGGLMARSGQSLVVRELAAELGVRPT